LGWISYVVFGTSFRGFLPLSSPPAACDLKILSLDPLPKLGDEIAAIEKLLSDLKANGGPIGEIRKIRPSDVPVGDTFSKVVENALSGSEWHAIHYGGHTHYDAKNRIGYLFFPDSGNDTVQPIKIDVFASWLKRADTRFVFLSNCLGAAVGRWRHLDMVHSAETP